MLYLKNTLGGLGRSLHDSALHTFQGPHRWWKLALYVVMFVLPGGSLGVLFFAWIDNRRNGQDAEPAQIAPVAAPATASACQARGDTPACRAAAGKQARQTTADSRI